MVAAFLLLTVAALGAGGWWIAGPFLPCLFSLLVWSGSLRVTSSTIAMTRERRQSSDNAKSKRPLGESDHPRNPDGSRCGSSGVRRRAISGVSNRGSNGRRSQANNGEHLRTVPAGHETHGNAPVLIALG